MKENNAPLFSGFANRYRTDDPAAPPTSANTRSCPGVAFSKPFGGGGGDGRITRIAYNET